MAHSPKLNEQPATPATPPNTFRHSLGRGNPNKAICLRPILDPHFHGDDNRELEGLDTSLAFYSNRLKSDVLS